MKIGDKVRLCNINKGTRGYDDQSKGTVFFITNVEMFDGETILILQDSLTNLTLKAHPEHIDVIMNIEDIDI